MQKLAIFVCGAVLGAAAFVLLYDLRQSPLQRYDEGTYAQVVQESLARKDFMSFTLDGQPWFDKPPLYFWLAGAATAASNDAAFGIRLPAALAAVALVGLVMLAAAHMGGGAWGAAFAGALLLWTGPFVQGAREARLDVLVGLCIAAALYLAWRRAWLGFSAAVGLALLAKSVVGIFALTATFALAGAGWEWNMFRERRLWAGMALAVLVAAPWHVWEWVWWGDAFWRTYIGWNVFERYQGNLFGSPALQADYWARLLDYAPLPLGVFLLSLVAAAVVWSRLPRPERAAVGGALALLAFMTAVFVSAQTRALSYLIPLYPMAALAAGLVYSALARQMGVKKSGARLSA